MREAPCQSARDARALKWEPPSHSQSLLQSRGQGLRGGLRLPCEYTKEQELKRCFGVGKRGRVCERGTGEGGGGEKKAVSKFHNIVYLVAPYMASVCLNVQLGRPALE